MVIAVAVFCPMRNTRASSSSRFSSEVRGGLFSGSEPAAGPPMSNLDRRHQGSLSPSAYERVTLRRADINARRELMWRSVYLVILIALWGRHAANHLVCRADDRTCFSEIALCEGELPRWSSSWPTLTQDHRAQLAQPVKSAFLTGLTTLSDEDALLLSRVPGHVVVRPLDALSLRSAEHFGRHRGGLSLSHVRELSDDSARALGRHHGFLDLNGVTQLSDEALRAIVRNAGRLTLGLTHLSAHQAEILCLARGGLELPELRVIDEPVAEVLSRYPHTLDIGLAEMTPEVARHLAKRTADQRFCVGPLIDRLRLSATAARELAKNGGEMGFGAEFDGRAEDVLAALSPHRGELRLFLEEPLSPSMAKELSKHAGPLTIPWTMTVGADAAVFLARHRSALSLHTDSPDAVKALSEHQGSELELRLQFAIDEQSAHALARYRGNLIIHEAHPPHARPTAQAVSALARHEGRLAIPPSFVREDTIEAITAHVGGLHVLFPVSTYRPIAGLHERHGLDPALDVEIARKLGAMNGWLRIDALLSADCLHALAQHKGDLVLRHLPQREDEVGALAGRDGNLYFPCHDNCVKSIAAARLMASDAVVSDISETSTLLGPDAVDIATELARKHGPLSLPHLRYITVDALRALVQKPDIELMPLDEVFVFDKDACIVPAEDVVPDSFREFNQTHQPPRVLDDRRRLFAH